MITPEEIATKAENAYNRFLSSWVRGDDSDFFPMRIPANLALIKGDVSATIKAVDDLRRKAKETRGWGYTVHWQQVRSRDFGNNLQPERITIETRDDLVRLAGRESDYAATCKFTQRVREELPALSDWLSSHVRSISGLVDSIDGLIAVTNYFVQNPWPDCYARQLPVPVDTKFIERHQSILRQWLDILLPASAIDVNETKFIRRFGLRDADQHRGVRVLDQVLTHELGLPFEELSLPLRSLANLPVRDTTVIIVENKLNLFTLPAARRSLGLLGEGKAVTRLERLKWLHDNRMIYWGDIDVDGFHILSSLRNLFPHAESAMMDRATLDHHRQYIIDGTGQTFAQMSNLTEEEAETFQRCCQHNLRLEQERVLQSYVDSHLPLD